MEVVTCSLRDGGNVTIKRVNDVRGIFTRDKTVRDHEWKIIQLLMKWEECE